MAQNYMFMPLEELKLLSYEQLLEAKTEVESIDPLDVNRYNIIVNTLAEKTPQLAATVVSSGEIVVERTPFEFIQKIDFDKHCEMPGINRIVQLMLDNKAKSLAAEYEERINKLESELAGETEVRINLEYQNKKLLGDNQLLGESNLTLTTEKNRYKDEAEDYKKRFEAAANALVEKDAEIDRLKHRESDLQEQIARMPAPTARPIIDITADEDLDALIRQANERKAEEQRKKEEERLAKRPKITNKRWENEIRQQWHLAELVGDYPIGKNGETIRFNRLDENLYVEVSNEEARFLREQAANAAAEVAVTTEEVQHIPLVEAPVVPAVEPVEQFRTEEAEAVLPGSDHDTVPGTVAEQTLEEAFRRIEILERKVSEIVG